MPTEDTTTPPETIWSSGASAPRIVSWTLCGVGRADEAVDAWGSAFPFTDASVIIDTAPEDMPPLTVAPSYFATVARWLWRDHFGEARNAGLNFAAETGADWGCMIDTDERAVCADPTALRVWLAALPQSVAVVLVHAADGTHTRERFFRLPSRHRFVGRTHEMYIATEAEQAIAPPSLITWTELPKTREQLIAKFFRDADMLRADICDDPKNGSAHFYLGASLQALACYAREDGDEDVARYTFQEAIEAFREHRRIDTTSGRAWHEGTAWSCFKAAECYLAINEPNRAIDCAAAGLVLDAGIAELYWIAAVASLQQERHEQARCWALAAKAHGMGSAAEQRRRGFRNVRGLTAGPDEVLHIVSAETIIAAVAANGPRIEHDETAP